MSKKVAKLVSVSFITRVIVDVDSTEEEISKHAEANVVAKIRNNEMFENLEYIQDDTEVPFNTQDAVQIAMAELARMDSQQFTGDTRSIIQNRVCELLGENFKDDEFDQEWERLH